LLVNISLVERDGRVITDYCRKGSDGTSLLVDATKLNILRRNKLECFVLEIIFA
jgi:hypothetical protein